MKPSWPSVLVLYNLPRESARPGVSAESEAGVIVEMQAVSAALASLGVPHRAAGIATLSELPTALAGGDEAVVFNLVEGLHDRPEEANLIPAVCAAYSKACTGGDTPALTLSLDKWRTKAVLSAAGLPTPAAAVVAVGQKVASGGNGWPMPCIVKPAASDASEGIHAASSIFAKAGPRFARAVRDIHERFGQPALVEEFFGTRELNVSVIQRDGRLEVLPLAEIDFSAFAPGKPRIVDYAAKWLAESFEYHNTPRVIPAPLPGRTAKRVRELALAAWRALDCRDYARVDFRLDEDGNASILEVNVNPDISPDAGFAAALAAAEIPYEQFVAAVVRNAHDRLPSRPSRSRRRSRRQATAGFTLRRSDRADRDAIVAFMQATGFFRADEMTVAAEVLDEALAKGPAGHYQSYTAEKDGRAVGWVCFGPTPCTLGTYDLYWIAVAPAVQGLGVGAALMTLAEQRIAESGGRLVIVETAGRPQYLPTRRFYEKLHYREQARLKNFYAPGDDKVVYVKGVGEKAK